MTKPWTPSNLIVIEPASTYTGLEPSHSVELNSTGLARTPPAAPVQRNLFGLHIDAVTMQQAVTTVFGWIQSGRCDCPFVVTPNVDHVVQLHRRPELLPAYRAASLTVADGWPIVTAAVALPAGTRRP